MQTCVKCTRYARSFLMTVSAAFIGLSTLLATVNAIARFMSKGIPWTEELCAYFVVMLVYFALPQLEGSGDQLCITAIDMVVKGKTGQRILNYLRGVFTGAAMLLLSYYGFQVMMKAVQRSQVTYVLQFPKSVLYGAATFCLAITVIVWLVIMICNKGEFDEC